MAKSKTPYKSDGTVSQQNTDGTWSEAVPVPMYTFFWYQCPHKDGMFLRIQNYFKHYESTHFHNS